MQDSLLLPLLCLIKCSWGPNLQLPALKVSAVSLRYMHSQQIINEQMNKNVSDYLLCSTSNILLSNNNEGKQHVTSYNKSDVTGSYC